MIEFYATEDQSNRTEKATSSLSHLIGSKDEDVRFLPDLSKTPIEKDSRRHFTEMEKLSLIEEDGAATNSHKVDVKGTHYETQSADEIALMILPLKGF